MEPGGFKVSVIGGGISGAGSPIGSGNATLQALAAASEEVFCGQTVHAPVPTRAQGLGVRIEGLGFRVEG